ncbi:UNVERIFIED_CONTAM: hypothetical protein GTU68_029448, partial [Idotea baltica]|nr:hypothetical protein [Idotea baltica]
IVTTEVGSGLNIKSLFSASYATPPSGSLATLSPSHTPPLVSLSHGGSFGGPSLPLSSGSLRVSSESLENLSLSRLQEKPAPEIPLVTLLKGLPEALLRQYEYEDPLVRGGKHLMHSQFFKILVALAADLELDTCVRSGEAHKWAWFRRYCAASRVLKSLVNRTPMPPTFLVEVTKKLKEMLGDGEELCLEHEDHSTFTHQHDHQLLLWFSRRPEDWTL